MTVMQISERSQATGFQPSLNRREKWLVFVGTLISNKFSEVEARQKVKAYSEGLGHIPESIFTRTNAYEFSCKHDFFPSYGEVRAFLDAKAEALAKDNRPRLAAPEKPKEVSAEDREYIEKRFSEIKASIGRVAKKGQMP